VPVNFTFTAPEKQKVISGLLLLLQLGADLGEDFVVAPGRRRVWLLMVIRFEESGHRWLAKLS
jgi:hypothetical protein